MINKGDEVMQDTPFQSLLSRYPIALKTSTRDSNFIFDCVHLLFWKCNKLYFKHGRSYIDSHD